MFALSGSHLITAANFCMNGKFAVIGTYDGRCIFYETEVRLQVSVVNNNILVEKIFFICYCLALTLHLPPMFLTHTEHLLAICTVRHLILNFSLYISCHTNPDHINFEYHHINLKHYMNLNAHHI